MPTTKKEAGGGKAQKQKKNGGGEALPGTKKYDARTIQVLEGVEAVIDKDHTASVLAKVIGAEVLMILTDVEKVALNFGKPDQKGLDRLTLSEAASYLDEGQFAKGSMGPKVEAACQFVKSGGDKVRTNPFRGSYPREDRDV